MKNNLDILKQFDKYTASAVKSSRTSSGKEYAQLQATWNRDIISHTLNFLPSDKNEIIGIGSFLGILEMAFADSYKKVNCVDFKSFLPRNKPKNVSFIKTNIDSADWRLPDKMYDVCFFIETIEHLLWSPLPLLNWMKTHSHISVISTPDDKEWPAMDVRPWTRYQKFSSIPSASKGNKGNPEPMFHCKQYTQSELIEMLDFVGFRVLEFFRTGEGGHQMVAIVQPRQD